MERCAVLGAVALALSMMVVGVGARGQITKQGNAYVFRMKFTKGEKLSYVITSSASVPGAPGGQKSMTLVAPLTMTVQDVQGKVATVKFDVGTKTVNGQPFGQPAPPAVLKLDDRGRPAGNSSATQAVATQLPEKPIRVGETFSSTTNVAAITGQQMAVKSTNKLVGFKKLGSRTVAIISSVMSGSGAMKVSGTGTTYLDVADGSIVSMTANQKMTLGQGPQAQTIPNVVKLTRK